MLRFDVRGPGGNRLLLLEVWNTANLDASFETILAQGCLDRMLSIALARRVDMPRAACLGKTGRRAEAILLVEDCRRTQQARRYRRESRGGFDPYNLRADRTRASVGVIVKVDC